MGLETDAETKYGIKEDLKKKKIEMPKTVEVPLEQLDQDAGPLFGPGAIDESHPPGRPPGR